MSITAFPVLARILTDRRMSRTELGVIALSCAATDDVTAWCLLAFVVGVAQAQVGAGLVVDATGTLAYITLMFLLVRPLLRRAGRTVGDRTPATERRRLHIRRAAALRACDGIYRYPRYLWRFFC